MAKHKALMGRKKMVTRMQGDTHTTMHSEMHPKGNKGIGGGKKRK